MLLAQWRAKLSRALADTKQIFSQTPLYNIDSNSYPSPLSVLNTMNYISLTKDPSSPSAGDDGYGTPAGNAAWPIWALGVGLLTPATPRRQQTAQLRRVRVTV